MATYKNDKNFPFQDRVSEWVHQCFGATIVNDKGLRNVRFIEEALELVQSLGMVKDDALRLVDYVYERPKGEPWQEVGGVMVTLAALCEANGIVLDAASEDELNRVWGKIEAIRDKQKSKPPGSPLPEQKADRNK